MKITRLTGLAAVGTIAALSLAGCAPSNEVPAGNNGASTSTEGTGGGSSSEELSGTISATGASSQTAAQEAWQAGFQGMNPGATVSYEPTGSGTGRENFQAGASQFIGSDRAFKLEEFEKGFGACAGDGIVELPLYISPVAVAFNLSGIETLNIDPKTLAGMFNGSITNWNDPAIAATNDGVDLPDQAISPVHRSDKSGTQGTFTEYLSSTAPDVWTEEPDDEWPLTGGEAAQGTSGVKQAITAGVGAIGFLDASQADGLGQVHVQVGDKFVAYSAEAASALVENSPKEDGRGAGDLVFAVDASKAPEGSYPIALISYLIGCEEYADANVAKLVKAYFTYMASAEGQTAAAGNAGSAPISDALREQVMTAIETIKVD